MSYGFELRGTNGNVQMSTENFGLMIADVFDVNGGSSGTRTYSDLDWHNVIYACHTTNIPGTVFSRSLASHSFVNFTITKNSNNIPTIEWTAHDHASACLGGLDEDTSSHDVESTTEDDNNLCTPGDKRPDVRIMVLVG